MNRTLFGVGGLMVAGFCLLAMVCAGLIIPFQVALYLSMGWIPFLAQKLPQVTVNGEAVLGAALCLVLLTGGLHLLAGRFYNTAPERRWPFRWTAGLVGIVVLMFTTGIAAVGVTHQTIWLARSPEPLVSTDRFENVARANSHNNLKQMGFAAFNYNDQEGHLPPGSTFDTHGRALHGWQTFLLPYLEQAPLYHRIDLNKPWDHPDNRPAFEIPVKQFRHSGVREQTTPDGSAITTYAANVRVLGSDRSPSVAKLEQLPRGTSYTILAGECAGNFRPWGAPLNWRDPAGGLNHSPNGFGRPTGRGSTYFLMADGSVRGFKDDTDPEFLKLLANPDTER